MPASKNKSEAADSGKRTNAAKQGKVTSGQDQCFVIMPFGGWFNNYYETIFIPAIKDAGLVSQRADDLFRPGNIMGDIWKYTNEAKIILADLTGKNANVFYELGLAHALAKPAILVVDSIDDVPFDLRALRVLEYDKNDPEWGSVLKEKITKSIGELLEEPQLSVPATFIETTPQRGTQTVSPEQKDIIELRQELENLRQEISLSTRARLYGSRETTRFSPTTAKQVARSLMTKESQTMK